MTLIIRSFPISVPLQLFINFEIHRRNTLRGKSLDVFQAILNQGLPVFPIPDDPFDPLPDAFLRIKDQQGIPHRPRPRAWRICGRYDRPSHRIRFDDRQTEPFSDRR